MLKAKRFLCKALSAATLALAYCTIYVFASVGLMMGWAVGLPLFALLLGSVGAVVQGRHRVLIGACLLAVFTVFCLVFLPMPEGLGAFLASVLLFVVVFLRARVAPFEEWPVGLMIGGIAVQMVGIMIARGLDLPALRDTFRNLILCYIPILLIYLNGISMREHASSNGKKQAPRRMRKGNQFWTLGVAACILIVSNLGWIRKTFYLVATTLRDTAVAVWQWYMGLFSGDELPAGQGLPANTGFFGAMEAPSETSMFWLMMEQALTVVATVVVIVLIAFGLYKLYVHLLKKINIWLATLRERARQLGGAIQDRNESLFDWQQVRAERARQIKGLLAKLRPKRGWHEMNNRERVRHVYAVWLRKHAQIKESSTAQEALASWPEGRKISDLYGRARYSNMQVLEQEVQWMRLEMDRKE